jgi:hypothetical protein
MKLEEVAMLLHLMNSLDARVQINKVRIASWAELLGEKADGLSFADARQIVIDHYSEGAEMLTPDIFVATHRRLRKIKESLSRSETAADLADRHCFRNGCSCSHQSCYRGWLDTETQTSPCRQCKPGLALVLDEIAPLGSRNPHDQQLLESIEHRRELLGWSGIR